MGGNMKKWFSFLVVIFLGWLLSGCSVKEKAETGSFPDDESGKGNLILSSADRKIIYKASVIIYIEENFSDKLKVLKQSLNADEWIDFEKVTEDKAYYTLRIKSTRLDAFLDSLDQFGTVRDLTRNATDLSLFYYDTKGEIEALEAERDRLVDLYQNATASDIIQIEKRITEINQKLRELNSDIAQLESFMDYSEVKLTVYNDAPEEKLTYRQKIRGAFRGGIKAILRVLELGSLVFVGFVPFALVLLVIGAIAIVIRKIVIKKKQSKIKK